MNETGLQRNLRAMLVLQTIEKKHPQNRWELFSEGRISLILHHSVPFGRTVGFGKRSEKDKGEIE